MYVADVDLAPTIGGVCRPQFVLDTKSPALPSLPLTTFIINSKAAQPGTFRPMFILSCTRTHQHSQTHEHCVRIDCAHTQTRTLIAWPNIRADLCAPQTHKYDEPNRVRSLARHANPARNRRHPESLPNPAGGRPEHNRLDWTCMRARACAAHANADN